MPFSAGSSLNTAEAHQLGKALQEMLRTAFSLDNFEPFLNKCLATLAGCPILGSKPAAAIIIKGEAGVPAKGYFRGFSRADRALLLAGRRPAAAPGRFLSQPLLHGSSRAGTLAVLLRARPAVALPAVALLGMAAQFVSGRLRNERRDAELAFERGIAESVKHIEELYLSFPGISTAEISRAVLDEARRLTRSSFGFAGYMDEEAGGLNVAALTREAMSGAPGPGAPIIFRKDSGLPGRVIRTRKPLLCNRADKDRRAAELPPGHSGIKKFLGVPALSGRRLLGVLALANPQNDYTQRDLAAAQKLARVYAMILQRKAAEDRQREEDGRFRAIVSSTKDVIYTSDLQGRITYVSPRAADFGYEPETLIGRGVTDFAHPEDKEFLAKAFANTIRTGQTLPIVPYRLRRADGSYAHVAQKSGVVFRDGKPQHITGVVRDVTEQKETERRLKESEALMRRVFDTAKDAIFIKDMNGMYVQANQACADLMRVTKEQMIGRTDSDFFPPAVAMEVFRTDSEVVRHGRTLSLSNHHPFPAGPRYVNIIKTPLKSASGETVGLLGIARDITELKRMESELAIAHAAEAVSQVARPMAHDFNNALAAINGYATLIDDDLPASSPIKKEISRIIEAVKRAAELTTKFQDFARNPDIKNPGEAGGGRQEKK